MEEAVFVENYSDDEGEAMMELSDRKGRRRCDRAPAIRRESSPPLLLAFSITSGGAPGGDSATNSPAYSAGARQSEEEEEEDEPLEEWMILGGEEEEGDSSIQLNMGYWSSSEDESGAEDPSVKIHNDAWAVSVKDKFGVDPPPTSRYFMPGRSPLCNLCDRSGHLAKNCYYHKKCPICVLCGIQGHVQRDCPSRPCPSCALPSHSMRPCEKPPVWKQLCLRCGMIGHLADTCPDTWRQYHLTIRLEVPCRPHSVQRLKHKKYFAHCYNCSKMGHHGYECPQRRMVSGTFPSIPYVCHYDTMDDILQLHDRLANRTKEPESGGSQHPSDQQHLSDPTVAEKQPVPWRSRAKHELCGQAGRRKTWPERRRERQEVKRLRREAQARREGGLLGRSKRNSDDKTCHVDPFGSPCHGPWQSPSPSHKKRRVEAVGKRSRKSREAERWKKRGGLKRGDLNPHGDINIGCQNLLSSKQRVRHRRR